MKKTTIWFAMIVAVLAVWVIGGLLIALLCAQREGLFSSTTSNPADYQIQFGILKSDSSGNYTLDQETSTLPLKLKDSGFRFGLAITPPDDKPYTYQCIVHLPTTPKVITGEGTQGIAPTTTLRMPEDRGQGSIVANFWFDPGDPLGDESIEVLINGKPAKVIHYTVVADKSE